MTQEERTEKTNWLIESKKTLTEGNVSSYTCSASVLVILYGLID